MYVLTLKILIASNCLLADDLIDFSKMGSKASVD